MYSKEEIEKAKEILKEAQNQNLGSGREKFYKEMSEDEKVQLLMRLSEENLILKKLIFDISKNKNYIIQKQDSENQNIKNWTFEFLNKSNESNGNKITIFYSKKLIDRFELLAKKDDE